MASPKRGRNLPSLCIPSSLTFEDRDLELAYLDAQRPYLWWTTIVAFSTAFVIATWVVIDIFFVSHTMYDHFSGPIFLNLVFNACVSSCSAVLVLVLRIQRDRISYGTIEALLVGGAIVIEIGSMLTDQYKSAILLNENPLEYWQQDIFSDSGTLLVIDLVITATHLFCPIRSCVSWIIPLCGVLSYIILSSYIGTQEKNIHFNFVCITLLALFSWMGRHQIDKDHRFSFVKERDLAAIVESKSQETISERVMRYNAERELDQTRMPRSDGITFPDGSSILSFTITENTEMLPVEGNSQESQAARVAARRSFSWPRRLWSRSGSALVNEQPESKTTESDESAIDKVDKRKSPVSRSGSAPDAVLTGRSGSSLDIAQDLPITHQILPGVAEEESEVSRRVQERNNSIPQDLACRWQMVTTVATVGIQTDTDRSFSSVATEEKATDPLLLFGEDGWKCQRCCKPPLPPASTRENTSKTSSLLPKTRKKRGTSSAGSSRSGGTPEAGVSNLVGPAQLSEFGVTPLETQTVFLQDGMRTWNLRRGGPDVCCPFHNATAHAMRCCKAMARNPCNPLYSPYSKWQCPQCFSMSDCKLRPGDNCEMCGFEVEEEDSSRLHSVNDSFRSQSLCSEESDQSNHETSGPDEIEDSSLGLERGTGCELLSL